MISFYLLIGILLISFVFFFLGNNQAKILANINQKKLHSLKHYYGLYSLLASLIPTLGIFFTITICDDFLFAELIKKYIPNEVINSKDYNFTIVLAQINNSVEGLIFGTPPEWVTNAAVIWKSWVLKSNIVTVVACTITILVSGFFSIKKIKYDFRSRNAVEKIVTSILAVSSIIALCVSIPVGLFSAIYLSEYATTKERAFFKPLLEILAGIPTVVYGFFAALTVAPFLRSTGSIFGLDVASESALAAGLVMGIMIIPFISSLSDDVINAVPQSLRDAGYGLGSTKNETVTKIVLPAALPGVVASIILAVSRAVGETMIVVMAAGLAANLTANPLEAVTTVTSQIVTILVGDQEFESAKTLSAFALALTLIIITLAMNFYALHIVKKYREQYE